MRVKLELEFEVVNCSHFIGAAQGTVTGVCLFVGNTPPQSPNVLRQTANPGTIREYIAHSYYLVCSVERQACTRHSQHDSSV